MVVLRDNWGQYDISEQDAVSIDYHDSNLDNTSVAIYSAASS